jgi:hypothetical protein
VSTVLRKVVELKLQNLGGKLLVIRKKPHAIDVVLNQNMPLNY